MFTRYVLPALALLGLALAIRGALPYDLRLEAGRPVLRSTARPASPPVAPPPAAPSRFAEVVHGLGLVESRREDIPIGTPAPGVVMEVFVDGRPDFDPPHKRVGDHVAKGDPLFRVDGRELEAELKVHEAALVAAEAQLRRLEKMPRPEDVPPLLAAVEEAEARLLDADAALARSTRLHQRNMLAASDYDRDRYARAVASAALDRARADLDKLNAGAWEEDLAVQRAAVLQARGQVERTRLLIDRLVIRAPVDGEILQVNVRPGQIATLAWKEPMIVLGEVDRLHIRVDVDESDLARFRPGAPGVATLQGRPEPEFPLQFVRVEPYVVPKRSLAGDNTERVDTRVLRVIYALPEAPPAKVYVGQRMDVFIDAGEPR
ncbi:HlyD family efflux transporter periplasmic adaptor subunit [Paludisphaera sp.]|uniref:HlyD family secretion protein n=1 Tax=Paludisphaera sp. TaxID=2017432 RepID=UPI00301CEAE0